MITLSLLPTSLTLTQRMQDVQRLEDEVEAMAEAAPPEVKPPLFHVQLLVDSYGEDLASRQDDGNGTVDGTGFDHQSLDKALESVRTWLGETCNGG